MGRGEGNQAPESFRVSSRCWGLNDKEWWCHRESLAHHWCSVSCFKLEQVHLKVPGFLRGFGLEESRGPEGKKKKAYFPKHTFLLLYKKHTQPPSFCPPPPPWNCTCCTGWGDKASALYPAHGLRSAPGHFRYLGTPEAARLGQGVPAHTYSLAELGLG